MAVEFSLVDGGFEDVFWVDFLATGVGPLGRFLARIDQQIARVVSIQDLYICLELLLKLVLVEELWVLRLIQLLINLDICLLHSCH